MGVCDMDSGSRVKCTAASEHRPTHDAGVNSAPPRGCDPAQP